MERPVVFKNRRELSLFGMVYEPDSEPRNRVGVLICVNAIKYRLGTYRLHVLLARCLADRGYFVMTFDPAGIGDSEGEFQDKLLNEHYYDIQKGKYNEDIRDACGFFVDDSRLDSLVLTGLCGGAISVLIEAAKDKRVRGLILLNLPVLHEDLSRSDKSSSAEKITTKEVASSLIIKKLSRLGQVQFWKRLVTFNVGLTEEYHLVRRALYVLIQNGYRRVTGASRTHVAQNEPMSRHRLFNMEFQEAFFAAIREKKRLYFIFAELDPWTAVFQSEVQETVLEPGSPYSDSCDTDIVVGANHIFSARDSRDKLEQLIAAWLIQWFSPGAPTHVRPSASTIPGQVSEAILQ